MSALPLEFCNVVQLEKLEPWTCRRRWKKFDNGYNGFDTMPECFQQTDGRTDGRNSHMNITRQYADARYKASNRRECTNKIISPLLQASNGRTSKFVFMQKTVRGPICLPLKRPLLNSMLNMKTAHGAALQWPNISGIPMFIRLMDILTKLNSAW